MTTKAYCTISKHSDKHNLCLGKQRTAATA
jgi:hypothetical protein